MHLRHCTPFRRALNAAMLVAAIIVFSAKRFGYFDKEEDEELFHD